MAFGAVAAAALGSGLVYSAASAAFAAVADSEIVLVCLAGFAAVVAAAELV